MVDPVIRTKNSQKFRIRFLKTLQIHSSFLLSPQSFIHCDLLKFEIHILKSISISALKDILAQEEFAIFKEADVDLTLDDIKFLTSGTKMTEDQMDLVVTKLLELHVKIFMLRAEEDVKVRKF